MLKLLAFVLPLGLDSFAVAAAIGATQPVTARQRLRISVIFVAFEAGMPLIGLTLGSSLARVIGDVADYLAAAAVIGVGAWMLTHGDGDDEQAAGRILATHGTAIVALGVSISLDELAIGFSLGLARLPLVPVIIAIGVQALIAAQLGLSLGARISEQLRERAEQVAAWPLGSGRCSPAELLRRRQPPPGLSHRLHGTAQLDLLLQQPVPRRPVLG